MIAQGVLGGMRVRLDERLLAQIHGCVGPAFFALTVALAVFTSRRWRQATQRPDESCRRGSLAGANKFRRAGVSDDRAGLRATGARLAAAARARRGGYQRLSRGSWLHLLVAAALAAHVCARSLARGSLSRRTRPALIAPAFCLLGCLIAQLALGGRHLGGEIRLSGRLVQPIRLGAGVCRQPGKSRCRRW